MKPKNLCKDCGKRWVQMFGRCCACQRKRDGTKPGVEFKIAPRPPDASARTSWWLDLPREQFYARAKQEQPIMSLSRLGRVGMRELQ